VRKSGRGKRPRNRADGLRLNGGERSANARKLPNWLARRKSLRTTYSVFYALPRPPDRNTAGSKCLASATRFRMCSAGSTKPLNPAEGFGNR
jgi:hypothetical protein